MKINQLNSFYRVNEILDASRQQIQDPKQEVKEKNDIIAEIKVKNYGLEQKIQIHEFKKKSLYDTRECLNSVNDNFQNLLEKYRLLLGNNVTVKKRKFL